MTKVVSEGVWVIDKSQSFESLTILPGASIAAPEGKYVTLTVDGIGRTIEPGTYTGDVVLTVCDDFVRSTLRFGEETVSHFHAGAIISDGKLLKECSVSPIIRGGAATDREAKDISIESHEWDFNGFYITGRSDYEINNMNMLLVGDGTDDFVGLGAGVAVTGDAKVTINNSTIHTDGIGRGTLYVGGDGEVTMNDCKLSTVSYVPTAEQMAEGAKLQRMMEPPWAIGLRGNGRTLNLAANGKLNLYRCHVTSNSWGVLSVDGARVNRMYVKDSLIELLGSNGYGCFCICDDFMFDYKAFGDHGCIDTIDHSTFNVPYTGIIMSLGNGKGEFKNGSVVNSGRFGAFVHRNSGGLLKINSKSVFNTKESTVVVKGSNTRFEFDDAVLKPENGTIIQLMDNDDVGMAADAFYVPVGIVDKRDNRDLSVAIPTEDVFVTISNMKAEGNFLNSTTNIMACNRRVPWDVPEGTPPPAKKIPDDGPPPLGSELPQIPLGPDGKPVLRGFVGEDLMGAKNMDVSIKNAHVTGIISSATAAYKQGLTVITKENCEELSNITQTPAEPINNGVIVRIDGSSSWTVTGTSWLTRLVIAPGAIVKGADGRRLRMTVDGAEAPVASGEYIGIICLSLE
ncbi:MAG: hypothetical protein ACOX7P_09105 [Oscillospiraceae bacterium]